MCHIAMLLAHCMCHLACCRALVTIHAMFCASHGCACHLTMLLTPAYSFGAFFFFLPTSSLTILIANGCAVVLSLQGLPWPTNCNDGDHECSTMQCDDTTCGATATTTTPPCSTTTTT